jgi:hypothetical protein
MTGRYSLSTTEARCVNYFKSPQATAPSPMREYAPAAYNIISHWAMRSRAGCWRISVVARRRSGTGRRCRCAAVRARCPKRLGEGTGMAQHAPRGRYAVCARWAFPTASTYDARRSPSSTSMLSVPDSFAA